MTDLTKAFSYTRERGIPGDSPYDEKFEALIKAVRSARHEGIGTVIVAAPWVLGDDYEEVLESLGRLAIAGLALSVVNHE